MDEFNSIYADILLELQCPVCINYMSLPIRQCETGHSICERCMKQLQKCPLCQTKFTKTKNIALQALALKVCYPCRNQSFGCDAKVKLDERENHEDNCTFRRYRCAMEDCTWSGNKEDIVQHWVLKGYKVISAADRQFHTRVYEYNANLVEAHNQYFWEKRTFDKGKIYWAVQLIGQAEEAANYSYEIDIFESENSPRRIILRDYCKSIEIDNNNLFSKELTTAVNTDCLRQFMDNLAFLNFYIRIKEV